MPTFTYRNLIVWKQGIELVTECYSLTERFPRSELYGLTNQLRRAAVSIPANIAEGHCRRETKPFRHHVSIAIGSHGELETYFELAVRLGFLSAADKTRILEFVRLRRPPPTRAAPFVKAADRQTLAQPLASSL